MTPHGVTTIISGGQTGADRGGLDAALQLQLHHGGWCPKGRRAEDGTIPAAYTMTETDDDGYVMRTKLNIDSSDATMIFCAPSLAYSPGTRLTRVQCHLQQKPVITITYPIRKLDDRDACIEHAWQWINTHRPAILNIAGNRESKAPGIQRYTKQFLVQLLG
jgi:hypothetical protein